MQIFRKHPDLVARLILVLLVLIVMLPFLNHAYHIDEPLFLRIARQIKEHPLDPYGFQYIWANTYEPMYRIAAFPPLFSYYLALVIGGKVWPQEFWVHLSLVPVAILGAFSFYSLSRQLEITPLHSFLGAWLLIASPVYVLSANLAMPDIMLISLTLSSIVLSIVGWKRNHFIWLILGGVILGFATLTRYNVLPLLLILFLLGLTYASAPRAVIPSAIASCLLASWLIYGHLKLGESHALSTANHFMNIEGILNRFWVLNTHLTLTTFLPFLMAILFWFKGPLWILISAFLLTDLLGLYAFYKGAIYRIAVLPDLVYVGLGIFTVLFVIVAILKNLNQFDKKVNTTYQNREFRISLLLLGGLATLSIPLIYIFFASKFLLLIQPVLILLLLHQLTTRKMIYTQICFILVPFMMGISLWIAASDFAWADSYRERVNFISEKTDKSRRVWFTGHWGWQYYLEEKGALPLPIDITQDKGPRTGDLILTAKNVTSQPIPSYLFSRLKLLEFTPFESSWSIRTMNSQARAGFYSNSFGPLPYTISRVPLEYFETYQVEQLQDELF